MATLFCQQSHAVVIDGQEYFFIQFVNIDNENDCRFVRAKWPDDNGLELGRMQTDNEQQGLYSDPVGLWRWDGDLLVCYSNNRYLRYDTNAQKYAVTPNRNEAVPMETFTDAHGNLKLRRKDQTDFEMGFSAAVDGADIVDVPSRSESKYAIGTATTYTEALSYHNETFSEAFYIRFSSRNAFTVGSYPVATDNGVDQPLTMTIRGNNLTEEDASNKLWQWVDGKYLRNLQEHYIFLDGTEFKTTADKSQATRFRIYYSEYARPKLRVLNADGTDCDLVARPQTVDDNKRVVPGSLIVSSENLNSTDDELELVDYYPTVNQPYFIRFINNTYSAFIHELGYPDSYNGHDPALFESPGTTVGGNKINNNNMIAFTANMKSMTWTLESSDTEGNYYIKSNNGLYIGNTFQYSAWGNRNVYTVKPTKEATFIIRTRDVDHELALTDAANPAGVFEMENSSSHRYVFRSTTDLNATNFNTFKKVVLDFIRNDDPLPQDVPAMEDGHWYKLSFGGSLPQTLIRAHVGTDGYYTLEHDKGRYVYWNGTTLAYTTNASQAAKFEIRAERSGWHLERVTTDYVNVKVVIAEGNTFKEVYQCRNANNTDKASTYFTFEEDTSIPLDEVETQRPTMTTVLNESEWYMLYFHDTPICAKKVTYVGNDGGENRIYTFMYGGKYLMWNGTNGYTTTTNADEATQFVVTRELTGWHLSRLVGDFYGGATVATKGNAGNSSFKEVPVSISTYFGVDLIPSELEDGEKYVFYFKNNELRGMYDVEMEHGGDCDLMNLYPNYGGMAWTALDPEISGDDFYYRFKNEFNRYIAFDTTNNKYYITSDDTKAAHFTMTSSEYGYYLLHEGKVFLPKLYGSTTVPNSTYFIEKEISNLSNSSNAEYNEREWASIYFQKVTTNDAWYDEATKNSRVIHRPSYFQERANALGGAFPQEFLKPGSGLTNKALSGGGSVDVQNTPEYRLTRYVKQGEYVGLYITTSNGMAKTHHAAYQRWYLYDSETPLEHKYHMPFNNNNSFYYQNGLVMGNGLINDDGINLSKKTAADAYDMYVGLSLIGRLPTNEDSVTIACDFSYELQQNMTDMRFENGTATSMGEAGNLTEPTLSLRQIWKLVDAKVIADKIVSKTGDDDWLEERTIHFPSRTQGLSHEYIPIQNDLENYWFYKNYTGDAAQRIDENLVSMAQVDGTNFDKYYRIVLEKPNNIDINLENGGHFVQLSKETDNGMFMSNTSHKRRRHISFSYPSTHEVPAGSKIVIKVFAKDADGHGNEYNVAKFTIIFDGGTETLPYMDFVGDDVPENRAKRSPNALIKRCGNPKAHLNFDYPRTFGFTSPFQTTTEAMMAALPLEYSTTNYAYARRKGNIRLAAGWGSSGIGNTHSATASTNNNKTYIIRSINDYLSEQNTGLPYPNTNTNTTYDPGFLFVDASDMPGQVATVSFDGDFCEGSLLMCSGWMASLQGGFTITNGTVNTSPGSVILTVMGRKPKGDGTYTEEEVYSFCPGQLPYHVQKADGSIIYPDDNKVFSNVGDFIWQQFYFEFYGNGSVEYYLKIDNNATSTDGGDYVLDDIWIFAVLPELETGSMLPLCGGELEMIRLENKYETLLNAVGIKQYDEENGEPEQTGYLNLTYIDWDRFVREFKEKVEVIDGTTYTKEEFLEKLEQEFFSDEIYEEDYRNVFDASLLKDDLDPTKVAYSCIKWSNKFDSDLHIPYTFDTFYNNSQDPESNINKVYYTTENGVRKLIFDGKMNISTFEYYHNYLLLAALSSVPYDNTYVSDFSHFFDVRSSCSTHTDLYMKPFLEVDGHKGVQDLNELSHCLNSIETLAVNLTVWRYDEDDPNAENGYVVETPSDIYFDWWVGTNTVSGTVDNFLTQDNGKSPTDPDYFTLQHALKCLRYNYPNASILEGLAVPATNDEYSAYTLTADILQYLKDLVTPPDGSMPQLYLHSQTVNAMLDEENFKIEEEEDGNYIYICAMPIELDINSALQQYYYSCSEPQPIKVRVEGVAPHIDLGFADKKYPDQLDLLSVRLAKSQFEKVNIRNAEDPSNPSCLHIPLRNVMSESEGAIGIKNVGIRNDGVNGDVILLTATTDTEMENYLLNHYNDYVADNEMNGVKVGTITYLYGTNGNTEEKPSETLAFYFDADFKVREGYSYTLKFPYTERFANDAVVSTQCDGYGAFIIKIVPDYEVWTEGTGNIDWSNDNNWRRASREELYADNGITLTSYLDNGHVKNNGEIDEPASNDDGTPHVNYITAEDRQRMQGFAPLYCTNILMLNKETADAPELYDDGPEVINGVETGFPALHTTASPMIRYDFQGHEWPNLTNDDGTSNTSNNEANPYNSSKMVRKEGDIVTELYSTNQCGGIVFQSKTELVNTHLLNYNKAWVEFELPKNKWHLVSSPLQGTISGEWYAPTWSGRQETTYFEPIQFDVKSVSNIAVTTPSNTFSYNLDYDRFAPAVYQRQWDKARAVLYERGAAWSADDADQAAENDQSEGGQWSGDGQGYSWTNNSDEYLNRLVYKPFDVSKVNVAVRGSWSGAHNDHTVPYDNAGFSVMPINNLKEHNSDEVNTVFRLPKDDQYYDIWDWGKGYGIERRVRVYINDGRPWPENLYQLVEEAIKYGGDSNDYMPREDDNEEDETNTSNIIELENRGRLRSDFLASSEEYEVTLKNEGLGSMGYFLASNPFICGLDMEKFFEVNTHLEPYYLVLKDSEIDPENPSLNPYGTSWKWTDMSFAYNDGSGNTIVPPRYAFFVKTTTAQNEVTLKFTADMMVSTSRTTTTGGGAPSLRIKAERDGNNSEATVMISSDASNRFVPGEDMETFVVSDISSKIPVIYTLTGHLATSINRIHDFMVLPIGIESNSDELVNVTFEGVENLGDSLMLYDTMTEKLQPLKSGTTTQMPGRTQNRFYIVKGENLQEAIEESSLQITASNGRITVTSTTNQPITDVRVYDAGGRQVYEATPNRTKHRFSLLEGTYVVKAKTDFIQQAKKVHN
jgi:hypothetical protein